MKNLLIRLVESYSGVFVILFTVFVTVVLLFACAWIHPYHRFDVVRSYENADVVLDRNTGVLYLVALPENDNARAVTVLVNPNGTPALCTSKE